MTSTLFYFINFISLLATITIILFLLFRRDMEIIINPQVTGLNKHIGKNVMSNVSWITQLEIYKAYMKWGSRSNRVDDTKASICKAILHAGDCDNTIIITTKNHNEELKRNGGDWWTVLVKNAETSIAVYMKDENNGSYTGRFVTPLAGEYVIYIVLDTTNWDGIKDPPKNWYKIGSVHGRRHTEGLGRINHLKREELGTLQLKVNTQQAQLSRHCYTNPLSEISLNPQEGYWYKSSYRPSVPEKEDYSTKYDHHNLKKLETLLIFGDSLQKALWNSLKVQPICTKLFKHCINHYERVYRVTSRGTKEDFFDNKDFDEKRFFHEMRDALQRETVMSSKSVVVINFGIHFLKALSIERCMKLFRMFINFTKTLAKQFGDKCPKFIWKETTPPMVERSKYWHHTDFRFLTKQRVAFWNKFTSEVLEQEKNIYLLHVHDMALSYPNKTRDQVHYHDQAFASAEKALYQFAKKLLLEEVSVEKLYQR